ncbi:MAG: NAD(P)-dependent oxidoreductase [Beijerinckiaceae bacterium]
MSTLAFIGLGAMGRPMARNLMAKGNKVRGFDLTPASLADLANHGGIPCQTAAIAAEGSDALLLMVVNAEQAEQVLFADGAALALGHGKLVILMATCPPDKVKAIGEKLAAVGIDLLDAPVSGGVVGAEKATLTIMAGGPKATFNRAKPLLDALGDKLRHVGENLGDGAAMKTVNQLLCGIHIAAAAECIALAEKLGLDGQTVIDILSQSAAGSWMLANRGPRMVMANPPVTSAVDIFVKDMGIVLAAGEQAKVGLPLSALTRQLFLQASGQGLGREDDSQVVQVYRGK